MPVIRYRDVSDVPPAIHCAADITPEEGLRLACELSSIALRLAASSAPRQRVQKMHSTVSSFDSSAATDDDRQPIRNLFGTVEWDGDLNESRSG